MEQGVSGRLSLNQFKVTSIERERHEEFVEVGEIQITIEGQWIVGIGTIELEGIKIHTAIIEDDAVVGQPEVYVIRNGKEVDILGQQSAIEEEGTHRSCYLHATSHFSLETQQLVGHKRREHIHRHIQKGKVGIKCPFPFSIIGAIQLQDIPIVITDGRINHMTCIALWHIGETRGHITHVHAFISKSICIHDTLHHVVVPLVNIGGIHIQHTVHLRKSW